MQTQIKVLFYTVAPDAPCDVGKNPDSLFDTWRKWVDAYNPDVVVYLARGETFDQEVGGQWQNIGQAGFDGYLVNRYRQAVVRPRLQGGQRRPAHDPLLRQRDVTRRHAVARGRAGAGDGRQRHHAAGGHDHAGRGRREPGLRVRPQRRGLARTTRSRRRVDQINVRCTDGVHFTRSGGIYVGRRLAPELAALGQAHATASPGGGWPGPLPPSTPSWFTNLPCQ